MFQLLCAPVNVVIYGCSMELWGKTMFSRCKFLQMMVEVRCDREVLAIKWLSDSEAPVTYTAGNRY